MLTDIFDKQIGINYFCLSQNKILVKALVSTVDRILFGTLRHLHSALVIQHTKRMLTGLIAITHNDRPVVFLSISSLNIVSVINPQYNTEARK